MLSEQDSIDILAVVSLAVWQAKLCSPFTSWRGQPLSPKAYLQLIMGPTAMCACGGKLQTGQLQTGEPDRPRQGEHMMSHVYLGLQRCSMSAFCTFSGLTCILVAIHRPFDQKELSLLSDRIITADQSASATQCKTWASRLLYHHVCI